MLVELGNTNPVLTTAHGVPLSRPDNGALVTYAHIPDPHIDRNNQQNAFGFDPDLDPQAFRTHLVDALLDRDGITRHPDNEAAVTLLHPRDGLYAAHAKDKPSFVWSTTRPSPSSSVVTTTSRGTPVTSARPITSAVTGARRAPACWPPESLSRPGLPHRTS